MRSRYTAYVRKDIAHLTRTSHPLHRAKMDARGILGPAAPAWCGLEIVATRAGGAGDSEGVVHFRASYRTRDGVQTHEERSRFIRIGGSWVYRDDRGVT
jgi:SEC-C motif-containing protein